MHALKTCTMRYFEWWQINSPIMIHVGCVRDLKEPTPTLYLSFCRRSNPRKAKHRRYYIASKHEGLYRSVSYSPRPYGTRGTFGKGGKVRSSLYLPACLPLTLILSCSTRDVQISIDTVIPIGRPVRGNRPRNSVQSECLQQFGKSISA